MMYGSWDMKHKRFFCHFGPFFAFLPHNNPKIKILKNWRKSARDIIILHKCTKNHDPMLYCSWDIECDRCNFYFSFWAIICLHFQLLFALPPPSPFLITQKIKIKKKNEKKCLEISSFYTCVPKIMITWCTIPETWCATDRWTDGWTEKVTEVGAPPKKSLPLQRGSLIILE